MGTPRTLPLNWKYVQHPQHILQPSAGKHLLLIEWDKNLVKGGTGNIDNHGRTLKRKLSSCLTSRFLETNCIHDVVLTAIYWERRRTQQKYHHHFQVEVDHRATIDLLYWIRRDKNLPNIVVVDAPDLSSHTLRLTPHTMQSIPINQVAARLATGPLHSLPAPTNSPSNGPPPPSPPVIDTAMPAATASNTNNTSTPYTSGSPIDPAGSVGEETSALSVKQTVDSGAIESAVVTMSSPPHLTGNSIEAPGLGIEAGLGLHELSGAALEKESNQTTTSIEHAMGSQKEKRNTKVKKNRVKVEDRVDGEADKGANTESKPVKDAPPGVSSTARPIHEAMNLEKITSSPQRAVATMGASSGKENEGRKHHLNSPYSGTVHQKVRFQGPPPEFESEDDD